MFLLILGYTEIFNENVVFAVLKVYVVPKRNDFFGYRMIEALAKHIKPFLKKH